MKHTTYYDVYSLVDPDNVIRYIGYCKDIKKRMYAHKSKGLSCEVVRSFSNKIKAMDYERLLINQHSDTISNVKKYPGVKLRLAGVKPYAGGHRDLPFSYAKYEQRDEAVIQAHNRLFGAPTTTAKSFYY